MHRRPAAPAGSDSTRRIDADAAGVTRRGAVGRLGYFTLAIGAVVGSGWVIVLGEWLRTAAPGGTITGFILGGLAMMLIAICYGELVARCPTFGGEFIYVLRTLGRLPAFLVGWFLTLYAVSICAFEAVVLTSLLAVLAPGFEGPTLYTVGDSAVHAGGLIVGLLGVLLIGALHFVGVASAIRFQNFVTLGFLVALALLVAAGLWLGSVAHWHPLFRATAAHSIASGILWVFSTCAFFLNGWQTALHAIEERQSGLSVRAAVMSMVGGIFVGVLAYCGIVLSASAAVPWQNLLSLDMPAVAAFAALVPGGVLGTVVVVIALVSVLKTWNAIAWIGTRLVVAQAREGFVPRILAQLHPRDGAPRPAVLLITGLSLAGPLLGRAAILPIVNMVAICLALSIVLCLLVLLRRRQLALETPSFVVPGGTATIVVALAAACLMIGVAVVEPLLRSEASVPLEWKLIGLWAAFGLVTWLAVGRRAPPAPSGSQPR
jgi:amino acid transporter